VNLKETAVIEKKVEILEVPREVVLRNRTGAFGGVTNSAPVKVKLPSLDMKLIEQVTDRVNMEKAYRKVVSNKGSAGVDDITVDELKSYLWKNWAKVKDEILKGTYKPKAVRVVKIPKPSGGERMLGIPTVMDRLIQKALHQTLSPIFDTVFTHFSFGLRAGKSAHGAILQAKKFQMEGRRWVVDMDIEKFFDEVNHDVLMSKIAREIRDKRVLKLIRSYLQSGIMVEGLEAQREKGTPQGSPLSPLLSNIMLDELDKELEKRGHTFCRYADDCNIYVKSRRSGERVLKSIGQFLEVRLKLRLNHSKSGVFKAHQTSFLGYSFMNEQKARIRVPKESVQRFRNKAKEIFRRARGQNIRRVITEELTPFVRGWINYFRLAEVKRFAEELDGWIRRRLRLVIWKQWKRPWTRRVNLMKYGIDEERAVMSAFNQRGPWWNSGALHMNEAFKKKFFDSLGLVSMLEKLCV
jgi:RNA-directed DNA polymerase